MERKLKLNFLEVSANIDYWSMQVPTYENAFSVNPRWSNNSSDQFICTAVFKKQYLDNINSNGGPISRCSENMLPAFFVYESDKLPLNEQLRICNLISSDPVTKNWVFSQTYSGSKSIHTLVYIAPTYREDVSKDFKYYWRIVGERLFGKEYVDTLDSQCASIGRLSRNPNGIRENGIKQTCIYYNSDYDKNPFNLRNQIIEHNEFLRKREISQNEALLKRQQSFAASKDDEMSKLQRIFDKGKSSEAFNIAYNVIINNNAPKGANYVAAANALKGCGFSGELIRQMLEKASEAHPTNISKRSIENILRKLNV